MTLDELIAELTRVREDGDDAGSWSAVVFHEGCRLDKCCFGVTDVVVGECIGGTVVEIWFDDEA